MTTKQTDLLLPFLLLLAALAMFGWYICEQARIDAEWEREKYERNAAWSSYVSDKAQHGNEWARRSIADAELRNHRYIDTLEDWP